jgi:hypothetical protein
VIYAYGIAHPSPTLPPGRRGLGGAALRVLETRGLAAVYSQHRRFRARPEAALVIEHERVLEAVMACAPVLPMRFGTQLDSTERLAAAVAGRHRELRAALDRVRGRVELGVRVLPTDPPAARPPSPSSGRDHLLSLAAARRRDERIAGQIHHPLDDLAAGSVVREHSPSPTVMVAAYLVDTGQVDSFRHRADEVAASHPDVRVVVTGPWPPYSFTGEGTA